MVFMIGQHIKRLDRFALTILPTQRRVSGKVRPSHTFSFRKARNTWLEPSKDSQQYTESKNFPHHLDVFRGIAGFNDPSVDCH